MREILLRIIIGLAGIAFGTLLTVYANRIIDNTGRIATAERYLGGAGSYTFVRIVGIFLIFFFLSYMTGILGAVYLSISKFLLSILGTVA